MKTSQIAKGPETAQGAEIRSAALSHIGASPRRTLLEDRSQEGRIRTAGGLVMMLGAVADGIGGENAGERAAELTIQAIFEHCEQSTSRDVPEILRAALERANALVYAEARRSRRKMNMGSTAAVAAVVQHKLYIANAGDSRIYLIRQGTAIPLTIDHTWSNEVIRSGKLTPKEAHKHPRRDEIVRSIGNQEHIDVDLGVWLRGGTESDAEARATQGLLLRPGDRVLICSDGVTKSRRGRPDMHYVETQELSDLVNGNSAVLAVSAIIKRARSRDVDDNVSAVILEYPIRNRFWKSFSVRTLRATALGIIFLAAGTWTVLRLTRVQPQPIAAVEIPPLPSGVAYISLLQGMAEKQSQGSEYRTASLDDIIPAGNGVRIRTLGTDAFLRLDLADGSILYLGPDTQIEFRVVGEEARASETFIVLERGIVLASPGEGNRLTLDSTVGVTARAMGSLMGAIFNLASLQLHIDCFEGFCTLEGLSAYELLGGQHSWMDANGNLGQFDAARSSLYAFAGILAPIPTHAATSINQTAESTETLEPIFVPPAITHTPLKPATQAPRPITATPTDTPTSTPTETPTPTETDEPTETPTETSEPSDTPQPSDTPSETATDSG